MPMRSGLFLPLFDELADPAIIARLSAEAEEAGWHGVFVWDHVRWRQPVLAVADPWVTLAAVAVATERVRLGPMVTPLARRRPVKVARETATLDLLSGGRLTLGVGLGSDRFGSEFSVTGEEPGERRRARMLDESLDILTAAWSGQPVRHRGEHYTVDGMPFLPRPVQRPGVPVWVAGFYGKPASHARYRFQIEQGAHPLGWLARASLHVQKLSDPQVAQAALYALTVRLDGSRAAAATIARKRAVFHDALGYAVELGLLLVNPLGWVRWNAPRAAVAINPQTVASPSQVRTILANVARLRPELTAFFGCLYYAALRPEEAVALRRAYLVLPWPGRSKLILTGACPRTGSAWTSTGTPHEPRCLKHRPDGAVRTVPVPGSWPTYSGSTCTSTGLRQTGLPQM